MIELRFGFLGPSLIEQLQGSGIDGKTLMIADQDAKAILRLHLRGFMRGALRDRMFRRIIRTLERAQAKGPVGDTDTPISGETG